MSLTFSSGQIYSGKTLKEEASISSGGVASNTNVNYGGYMNIAYGGVANDTTVNSGGNMTISCGVVANDTTVNSGGEMTISGGGTANKITVKSGGEMTISSGGSALNVNWTPCNGDLTIADGAVVTFTSKYSGVYFGSNGQLLSQTTVMNGKNVSGYNCSMFVMSGGVANDTTVDYDGDMFIWSGGVANDTTVNSGGEMTIRSGGVV